jgi:hypothetical protein
MAPEAYRLEEERMVQEDRWREIHRMAREEQLPIAEIARRLDLDRKTVRRCLKQEAWQPYQRLARTDTVLAEHADFLRERAPQVDYAAQVLFQELRLRGYTGGFRCRVCDVHCGSALSSAARGLSLRLKKAPPVRPSVDGGSDVLPPLSRSRGGRREF